MTIIKYHQESFYFIFSLVMYGFTPVFWHSWSWIVAHRIKIAYRQVSSLGESLKSNHIGWLLPQAFCHYCLNVFSNKGNVVVQIVCGSSVFIFLFLCPAKYIFTPKRAEHGGEGSIQEPLKFQLYFLNSMSCMGAVFSNGVLM